MVKATKRGRRNEVEEARACVVDATKREFLNSRFVEFLNLVLFMMSLSNQE